MNKLELDCPPRIPAVVPNACTCICPGFVILPSGCFTPAPRGPSPSLHVPPCSRIHPVWIISQCHLCREPIARLTQRLHNIAAKHLHHESPRHDFRSPVSIPLWRKETGSRRLGVTAWGDVFICSAAFGMFTGASGRSSCSALGSTIARIWRGRLVWYGQIRPVRVLEGHDYTRQEQRLWSHRRNETKEDDRGLSQLQWKRDRKALQGWRDHNKVSLCDSDVNHRSERQIILFYAHVNKANGARKTCKLPSNWPVRTLKLCQSAVRKLESKSEGTYRITGLGSAAIHCTFHLVIPAHITAMGPRSSLEEEVHSAVISRKERQRLLITYRLAITTGSRLCRKT